MESKQLILLGPPGAGVEDRAIALSSKWQVPHVSMQSLIRQAIVGETATGSEIRTYREKNEPVPDELLLKLLRKRFEQPDVMLQGWILSGFPGTLAQAQAFDSLLSSFGLADIEVAHLKATTGILIKRLSEEGADESLSVLRERITSYKESIVPVMEHYQQKASEDKGSFRLTVINGSQSAAEVTNALARLAIEETGAARFVKDEAELDALITSESVLVVDCVASWCGPCKQVSPLMDKLAEAYGDRATVVKLDFDNNRQVAKRFELKGMPSVMFFKNGELQETLRGAKFYPEYDETLTALL